nr:hypothetical protein [Tanacetum cinerariifolium]
MAPTIIFLATNQKFNFSRYFLLSLVKNIDAGVPSFMFPRFMQLLIDHQLGDMSHHKDIYDNPSLTKKVFANMKRVGTGFSRVVTPLFDNMLVLTAKEVGLIQDDQTQEPKVPSHELSPKHRLPSPSNDPLRCGEDSLKLKELMNLCTYLSKKVLELENEVIDIKFTYKERIEKLEGRVDILAEENRVLKDLHSVHSKVDTAAPILEKEKSFKQGRIIAYIDEDAEINLEEAQTKLYRIDLEHPEKVMKYQALKRKPLSEAQAMKNMMLYLRNMAGFKLSYFKGMTYSEIRLLFEKHYNYNQDFLEEVNEEVTLPEKEVKVEGHKREEATHLASKIPFVDYKIHFKRNKPCFKIIRADGNHMLFLSFSTLLKNFDREDLESLWKIVKERFKKTEPKNYSDDYLLKTLKTMFKQPDVEANVWRDQKGRYGLTKRYPLTHFTLEQMMNVSKDILRLEVDEESEMSIELL